MRPTDILPLRVNLSKFPQKGTWENSTDTKNYGIWNDWRLVLKVSEGPYFDENTAWNLTLLNFEELTPLSALPLPTKYINYYMTTYLPKVMKSDEIYLDIYIMANKYLSINAELHIFNGLYGHEKFEVNFNDSITILKKK